MRYLLSFKYETTAAFIRGGSRTAATSKVKLFVIIVSGCKPLTIITKSSTLAVVAILNPLLLINGWDLLG